MTNVLILSENIKLKSELRKYLLEEGYQVVDSNTQVSGQLVFNKINLIVLDATSLKNDVAVFVRQLKIHNPLTVIIVVVDNGNVQAAVQSIHAGALDALALPLDKQNFLSSIKQRISQESGTQQNQMVIQQAIDLLQSLRERSLLNSNTVSKFEYATPSTMINLEGNLYIGELLINTKQEIAYFRDTPIDLTPSQFKLLKDLGESQGRVVPFEELYFHLHGIQLDRSSARIALSAHMSYLRNKLIAVGCGECLVNVRGRGYLLEIPEKINRHTYNINLDLILEQLPIILWTTDTDFRMTSILGAGLVQLGLAASEIIGLKLTDFPQLDNPHKTIDAHEQALRGMSIRYEQELKRRVFQMYIEPSLDENEHIMGCIGLALDITERKNLEEAYQILVDHSQQGLAILQHNRIVFANAALTEITGYTIEELLSLDDFGALIVPDDRDRIYENTRNRLASEIVSPYSEYRIIRKEGSVRYLEQTTFITNFRGQKALHIGVIDVTKQKEALEAHHQIEEMYRALAKNLPHMAILLFDRDLHYIIAEGQALEEMGYFRDKIEGKTIWEVLPIDRAETLMPYYRAALDGNTHSFNWNANNRIYEIQTMPIKQSDGSVVAGMFIIQDVTRHKLANSEQF